MSETARFSDARDEAWPRLASDRDFVTLTGMLAVLKRSLWRILLVVAVFLVAALAYVVMTPSGYTSTARILIESPKQQFSSEIPTTPGTPVDNAQVESQVEILRSEHIAGEVVSRLNLTEDPEFGASQSKSNAEQRSLAIAKVGKGLAVHRIGQSYVIEVSFSARDAEKAARITNAIGEAYIQDQLQAKADSARQGSQWMEQRLIELGRQLNAAANAVHQFKTANGIADRNEGRSLLIDKLTELEATAEAYRKLYETLLQRMGETEQQGAYPVSNARVIAAATPPLFPSYPKTKLVIALALLAGTMCGVGLTLVEHTLDHTVRTERQLTRELGIDCFGLVPRRGTQGRILPAGGDNPVIDEPLSKYADALRAVKISIDTACHAQSNWRLGLLPVGPADGKIGLAIGLGDLFAMAGNNTLLVDADLREAPLSRSLAPHARMGLLDALTNSNGDARILPDPKTNVHLLPAGAVAVCNSADMLASPAMRDVLDRLSQRFNVILVDLPPLARASDARVIGPALDGCILLVQWGTIGVEALKDARIRLEAAHIKLLGAVITDVAEGVPPLFGVTFSDFRNSSVLASLDRLVWRPLVSRWDTP